jgi:hypothetical protein
VDLYLIKDRLDRFSDCSIIFFLRQVLLPASHRGGCFQICISLLIETFPVFAVPSFAHTYSPEFRGLRCLKHAKAITAAAMPTTRPPTEPPTAAPSVVCPSDAAAATLAAEVIDAELVVARSVVVGVPVEAVLVEAVLVEAVPVEAVLVKDLLVGDVLVGVVSVEFVLVNDVEIEPGGSAGSLASPLTDAMIVS